MRRTIEILMDSEALRTKLLQGTMNNMDTHLPTLLFQHMTSQIFFLIFIFTLFYFTILYWFCHTLTGIHHGCTCVPKHEPPFHLPPRRYFTCWNTEEVQVFSTQCLSNHLQIVTALSLPFQFGLNFLIWLLWLGLSILCEIEAGRVGIAMKVKKQSCLKSH